MSYDTIFTYYKFAIDNKNIFIYNDNIFICCPELCTPKSLNGTYLFAVTKLLEEKHLYIVEDMYNKIPELKNYLSIILNNILENNFNNKFIYKNELDAYYTEKSFYFKTYSMLDNYCYI